MEQTRPKNGKQQIAQTSAGGDVSKKNDEWKQWDRWVKGMIKW
jgi:hypothetical protein